MMLPNHNPSSTWQAGRFTLDLQRPLVMGIVNTTPDSFSDGGRYARPDSAIQHAERLVTQGAAIVDVGGESSRPGAPPVSLDDELARVVPVVRELVRWGVPVSVDTYKPEVMQAVLDLGADIINDIWALRQTGTGGLRAEQVVCAHPSCGVCLMHMHGEPQTMQKQPMPTEWDALQAVGGFLQERSERLLTQGMSRSRIAWDMGIGFGKTVRQNFQLLAAQPRLLDAGYPLLVGWSRKSSLGAVTGLDAGERLVPSVAAAVLAVERGARIVRVHDVAETVAALAVWQAMRDEDVITQT